MLCYAIPCSAILTALYTLHPVLHAILGYVVPCYDVPYATHCMIYTVYYIAYVTYVDNILYYTITVTATLATTFYTLAIITCHVQ